MVGPKIARLLPRRPVGRLAVAAGFGVFGLVAMAGALPVSASCFSVSTVTYTGSTQTADATAGQSIHDTAVIDLLDTFPSVPNGTVIFNLYPNSTCQAGTEVFTSSSNYVGTGATSTGTITSGVYTIPTTVAGGSTYQWQASFSVPVHGIDDSSICGSEPVNVSDRGMVTTVPLPATGAPGTSLTDSSQVTGIADPASTDTVTFSLYLADSSDPASCTDGTLIKDFGASALVGTSSPWTATSNGSDSPTVAGTYLWQVQFNAVNDPNNLSSEVFCGEPVTITIGSTPGGGVLAASTTTPTTGSGLGGLGLLGGLAVLLGALSVFGGARLYRRVTL